MNFKDVVATRALVQAIDILRYDRAVSCGNRLVRWIWRGLGDKLTPPGIPLPDEFRITRESCLCRELLRTEGSPESAGATKGWNPAFG